jgi:hypothetical protein
MDRRINFHFRTKVIRTLILALVAVFLDLLYEGNAAARHWYTSIWYPRVSSGQRIVTGWCPFSMGDILYVVAGAFLLFFFVGLAKDLWRKKGRAVAARLLQAMSALVILYLVFELCWGLNYRSDSLEKQFRVQPGKYSTSELVILSRWLLDNTNHYHRILSGSPNDSTRLKMDSRTIFKGALQAYAAMEPGIPGMRYTHPSVKPSMFGYLMNYLGVSGYYNPFTGEAQVNTTIPEILQPYVCCHEIAHQLGFAPEEAANFVGYIAAMHSRLAAFRYSANFDLMLYALGELRFRDSDAEKSLWAALDTGVKMDYHSLREFYREFSNPVDPFMSRMYDRYLRANHEAEGIGSYDEVIGLLMQYYLKLHQ